MVTCINTTIILPYLARIPLQRQWKVSLYEEIGGKGQNIIFKHFDRRKYWLFLVTVVALCHGEPMFLEQEDWPCIPTLHTLYRFEDRQRRDLDLCLGGW